MRVVLALAALATAAALGWPSPGHAEPREVAARVVWVAGSRVYIAARDSGTIGPRLRITFLDRRRVVASGEIEDMLDGTLAAVRLATGSLDRIKRLDRLRVLAEPVERRAWPRLRVGVPAGTRENLAIDCAGSAIEFPLTSAPYRIEALGADAMIGVQVAGSDPGPAGAWPETLVVRRFADAIDEEIALERGEIDVAVFWPGEPSARLRGRPLLFGQRARGVIAVHDPAAAAGSSPVDPRLAAMNAELFGGDLLPWPGASGTGGVTAPAEPAPRAPRAYSVDLALPGHSRIEEFLNGGASLFVRGKPAPARVTRLDAPPTGRDSLAAGMPAREFAPLFVLRCPVAFDPAAADYVQFLGADAFANLVRCPTRGSRP